jgi:hypothetical protein
LFALLAIERRDHACTHIFWRHDWENRDNDVTNSMEEVKALGEIVAVSATVIFVPRSALHKTQRVEDAVFVHLDSVHPTPQRSAMARFVLSIVEFLSWLLESVGICGFIAYYWLFYLPYHFILRILRWWVSLYPFDSSH